MRILRMAKAYATGKKAFGFCDRCGFRYDLAELRREVVNQSLVNIRTCPKCWDEDHPQYRVGRRNYDDAQGLRDPRPDNSECESRYGNSIRYEFDSTLEDWTAGVNGTLTWVAGGSAQLASSFSVEMNSPGSLSIDTDTYRFVRIRINAVVAPNVEDWRGAFNWFRDIDGFIGWTTKASRPTFEQMGEQCHVITYDMRDEPKWTDTAVFCSFTPFSDGPMTVNFDYIRFEEF
jgi:hypothetical protein